MTYRIMAGGKIFIRVENSESARRAARKLGFTEMPNKVRHLHTKNTAIYALPGGGMASIDQIRGAYGPETVIELQSPYPQNTGAHDE